MGRPPGFKWVFGSTASNGLGLG
ncbi:hypothetical protein CCACVL1_29796 [Corchorus capsularis]|uniref:Uncharacterized protein n=1 Tax=Corchorus capsularis TaxID=210143 RepID=A0A1R3G021_COCAP|nr:hypothetical protein CCACVL1_29796 [Corchorus capsularis]